MPALLTFTGRLVFNGAAQGSYPNKFDKDAASQARRGKDTAKLRAVIELLVTQKPLPHQLQDHPLKGSWKGYRDLHIEPDWLLIYKADNANVWFVRTGTHADIF